MSPATPPAPRLHYLDALRAFALLLGIVFHASLSFTPVYIAWAVMDVSTSPWVSIFVLISHSFRMETFFLLAGFFSQHALRRQSMEPFLRSRFLRIVVPFAVGWFLFRPLIVAGWVMGAASMRGDYIVTHALRAGLQDLARLPAGLFTGTHLWFLYYLTLVTGLALGLRGLLRLSPPIASRVRNGSDTLFSRLTTSRGYLLLLALPTAATLWFMQQWGMDTPDRTLRPHIPVLLIYGGFFSFGWMAGRHQGALELFAGLSVRRWTVAIAATASAVLLNAAQMNPNAAHYMASRALFTASYAVMMWSLVSLTLGVARCALSKPNRFVRYLADASYWLYLVHLPVVVWLQVIVAEFPVHWLVKLAGISGVTVVLGLLMYDGFVRSTAVGELLNGRRYPRVLFPTYRNATGPIAVRASTD